MTDLELFNLGFEDGLNNPYTFRNEEAYLSGFFMSMAYRGYYQHEINSASGNF